MRILISGSLAYDKIMEYPGLFSDSIVPGKIHALNLSFVTENLREHFGGTAGNIAYGLSLLDESPIIFAAAGRDFGPYRARFQKAGVNVDHVRIISEKPTMVCTMMTDSADNQIAAIALGAMQDSAKVQEDKIPAASFAIVSPGNAEDMRRLPAMYRTRNIPFIFDPGQQIAALEKDDLKKGMTGAKVLISNDYELALLLKKTGWSEDEMLKNAEIIVTTLGARGSRIRTGEKIFEVPAAPVRSLVDPTGAGDAYRAGFIKGLLMGWPFDVAGRFAGVVAAFAVEADGPQGYQVTMPEVRARYEESFGTELPV
jgi:adenosine kinase